MQGTCENCLEMSKKVKHDWCCLLCTIRLSGVAVSLSKEEGDPVMIEVKDNKEGSMNNRGIFGIAEVWASAIIAISVVTGVAYYGANAKVSPDGKTWVESRTRGNDRHCDPGTVMDARLTCVPTATIDVR